MTDSGQSIRIMVTVPEGGVFVRVVDRTAEAVAAEFELLAEGARAHAVWPSNVELVDVT